MNLVLHIPDEIARRLGAAGPALERQALEALAAENFRAGRLSKDELAQVLGLNGGDQVDGFLKAHDVFESCAAEDIDRDIATLARLGY